MSKRVDQYLPVCDTAPPLDFPPTLSTAEASADVYRAMRLEMPTTPPPLRPIHRLASGPPRTIPPLALASSDFHFEGLDDDPPFRAPAIWSASPSANPPQQGSWRLGWSERSAAAFLGFAAGMLIIVPAVFYLSLEIPSEPLVTLDAPSIEQFSSGDPSAVASDPSGAEDNGEKDAGRLREAADNFRKAIAAPSGQKFVSAESASAGVLSGAASIMNGRWHDTKADAAPAPARSAAGSIELEAERLLQEGKIADARAILRTAASPDRPHLWFTLAETYDPLIAAGDGADSTMTAADKKFARYYYNQALLHGVAKANDRLAALSMP